MPVSEHEGIARLRSILSSEQLETVKTLRGKDRRHPLQRLLFPQERDEQVVYNTGLSLKAVFECDEPWLLAKKRHLLSIDRYDDSSSVLGEVRAYGSLLRCGISVKPGATGSGSSPDFFVDNEVFLEVHAKQPEPSEAQALEQHNNARPQPAPGERGSVRMHFYTPFGVPKLGESVNRNAIQKLAQIKQKAEEAQQFSDTLPSILWLDFQDEAWNLIISAHAAISLISHQGGFYSGPLWYAFYGWKGAPVFQGETVEEGVRKTADEMRHDGRFRQNTKIDAVIASFPRDTIILENPFSRKPVRPQFWKKLILLRNFNFELSHINWPQADLKQRIKTQKNALEALANEAIYSSW
jgi:hypothetical protein